MINKLKKDIADIALIRKSLPFLLILLSAFTLIACNKTRKYEDLDLLVSKDWRLISKTQNRMDITDNCDLDDVLFFEDVNSFNYNYGDNNCFDNEEHKTGTKWKIINDFTTLRMTYRLNGDGERGSLVEYWDVIELGQNSLIIQDALAEDNNQIPEIRMYQN